MNITTRTTNNRGLTLIEMSVIIGVLLGLIAVLFIGVTAYKEGNNRSKCILQVSSVQKAVRAHANMYQLRFGDSLIHTTTLIGSGRAFETTPVCPTYGAYNWGTTVPAVGTAYLDCADDPLSPENHAPVDTIGW